MSFWTAYAVFLLWFAGGLVAAFLSEPQGWKAWLYGPGVWIVNACWNGRK